MNAITKPVLLLLCSATAFAAIAAGCGGGSGGGSVSAATFCSELNSAKSQLSSLASAVNGTGAPPSKTAISNAASTLQRIAGSAPSAVKGDMQTEADDFSQWAKNGDSSALSGSKFQQADQALLTWHNQNCK